MIDTLDFFVRFWELKARHATVGEPLRPSEQIELLSLLQLVTHDLRIPKAGPVPRKEGSLPAELIGDGAIHGIELRSVSAAALIAASGVVVAEGSRVVVRASDAVRGVDYVLPCTVAWSHQSKIKALPSEMAVTLALIVDGIPTKTHFSSPPDAQARSALAMGRQERLIG